MKKYISVFILMLLVAFPLTIAGQDFPNENENSSFGGQFGQQNRVNTDSMHSNKQIPKGLKSWTVDELFGDRAPVLPDTMSYMYQNTIFTSGLHGEYNTLGNQSSPRINRIFINRPREDHFLFLQPYDFFIVRPSEFHFTNTLSPITNLSYNTAGDRVMGDDYFKALFGVNVNKQIGVGFKFDYHYARGYYSNQASSQMNYSLYGSYLGDRYQAHLLLSLNNQKLAENGGITNDKFITNPESFDDNFRTNEIPTVLQQNWNRNNNQHIFLTHRYSLGFNKKVPMTEEEKKARQFSIESEKKKKEKEAEKKYGRENKDNSSSSRRDGKTKEPVLSGRPENAKIAGEEPGRTVGNDSNRIKVNGTLAADSLLKSGEKAQENEWMKNVYVPVTSFIHTLSFDNYRRIYQAYQTPDGYYASQFPMDMTFQGDSLFDKTTHYRVKNVFAISLLEGFNKWAKAGIKAFASHELRHFSMPAETGIANFNENAVYVGGQLSKTEGKTLHYNVLAQFSPVGKDLGNLRVDGSIDLNFPLFKDTVRLEAGGFLHRTNPTFYYRHYHSRHLWWDNDDMNKIFHSRLQGLLSYTKTRTKLKIALDEIKNHTYFASIFTTDDTGNRLNNNITVYQESSPITLLTAELEQKFKLKFLNWETIVTFQKSTNENVIPVPMLNVYSNLYFNFKFAKVLKCDLGTDVRYFTAYYAPAYSPYIGLYTNQTNTSEAESGDSRTKVGNYPIVNVYANFHLQHTRFFVMYTHVNNGTGNRKAFLTPHYPINGSVFRFGLSWNFFN